MKNNKKKITLFANLRPIAFFKQRENDHSLILNLIVKKITIYPYGGIKWIILNEDAIILVYKINFTLLDWQTHAWHDPFRKLSDQKAKIIQTRSLWTYNIQTEIHIAHLCTHLMQTCILCLK